MADWPMIAVVIVTFYRPEEIRRTIQALDKHVAYPKDRLLWHMADDQSSEWEGDPVEKYPPETYLSDIQRDFSEKRFTFTVTERLGWGANVNKAQLYCLEKAEYIFLCEDDYVARKEVDLRTGIAILEKEEEIGLIRYDGIAGHALNLELREAKGTRYGTVPRVRIMKASPFLNVYSNRPHLKHRRFHDAYGDYPEGIPLGMTETRFAQTVKRAKGPPHVAVLINGIERGFDHIGKSRQHTEMDKTE